MFEAILLGAVQGITEFLPISSTAHLIILPWFFKWTGNVNTLTFDVALHGGTLLSLLICFQKDLREMFGKNRKLLFYILMATAPAGLAGFYFHDLIEGRLRSPYVIALTLVLFAGVMLFAERFKGKKDLKGMTFIDALFVGLLQAVALVPGVSRSGITISAGLMAGVKRHEAARFSFLLSIPAIAGATALEGKKILAAPGNFDLKLMGLGFAASTVAGVIAIVFLLKYLKRHSLKIFVYYRVLLAGFIAGWVWLSA